MDLPTNHFMTYNINYVYDHKKFVKNIMVFKITLTATAIGFSILQGKGKGFIFDKPLFLKLGSLYFLANNAPKYHLCQFTSYIYADCPFKKVF